MLWEPSGNIWRINGIMANSSIQMFSHDLGSGSGILFFNDKDRQLILDAAPQTPWAPEAVAVNS